MLGKAPTRAQRRRFIDVQDRGCVPCYIEAELTGRPWVPEPCDVHHVVQGDHDKTYGCCPWHHRGVRKIHLDMLEMRINFGPSMAREPAKYRDRYGSEEEILVKSEWLLLQSLASLMERADGQGQEQGHQG